LTTPTVVIVGADKGGVGKTTISRALLDYYDANNIKNRAFDTESPKGSLKRFHSDKTEIVDLTDSDDQMKVFDTLGEALTLIDIRAGLLTPSLKMLREIGFIDPAKCNLVVVHVLGNTLDSVGEIKSITESISSSKYVSVANHINNTKYDFPVEALNIPMLPAKAAEVVDESNTSFTKFIQSDKSPVLRGHTKHWLGLVFAEFDSAKLNVL
jgi:cellulose biosynthesis protein BcsQ